MAKNTSKKLSAVGMNMNLDSFMPNVITPKVDNDPIIVKDDLEVPPKEETVVSESKETEPKKESKDTVIEEKTEEPLVEEEPSEETKKVEKNDNDQEKPKETKKKDTKKKNEKKINIKEEREAILESVMNQNKAEKKSAAYYLSIDNIVTIKALAQKNNTTASNLLDDILTELFKQL